MKLTTKTSFYNVFQRKNIEKISYRYF